MCEYAYSDFHASTARRTMGFLFSCSLCCTSTPQNMTWTWAFHSMNFKCIHLLVENHFAFYIVLPTTSARYIAYLFVCKHSQIERKLKCPVNHTVFPCSDIISFYFVFSSVDLIAKGFTSPRLSHEWTKSPVEIWTKKKKIKIHWIHLTLA